MSDELDFSAPKLSDQCVAVYSYIRVHGSITSRAALEALGVTRLAARVNELRNAGYDVQTETIPVPTRTGKKAHVAKYTIKGRE